jgi:hypothetical protein
MATFSNVKVYSHQINNVEADIFSRWNRRKRLYWNE